MAVLPNLGLETMPTGTVNDLPIINADLELIDAAFGALPGADGITTITYASTITVQLLTAKTISECNLTGDLIIAVDEKSAGRQRFLILKADGTDRALTWPSGSVWATDPLTTVPSGTTVVILIQSRSTTDASLVLSAFAPAGGGGSGATPSWGDIDLPAKVTVSDFDKGVDSGDWSAFSDVPLGRVDVVISQSRHAVVGNASKLKECFFSADGGTTALGYSAIATATSFHWVGTVAGYQLTAADTVSFRHSA